MYTFNPLADVQVSHDGFWIILSISLVILVISLINDIESFLVMFFFATIVNGVAYGVSYHWTNQTAQTFVNEQVTAELVSFQPEGYNERSGKSRVDRHYMYVVYAVGGEKVILRAQEGVTYPQTATLYKN